MYFWIISKVDNEEAMNRFTSSGMKGIVIYILGALTAISTQVAAYYFGSSQGSSDKNKTMAAVTKMSSQFQNMKK